MAGLMVDVNPLQAVHSPCSDVVADRARTSVAPVLFPTVLARCVRSQHSGSPALKFGEYNAQQKRDLLPAGSDSIYCYQLW